MTEPPTLHDAAEYARRHPSPRRQFLGVIEGCKTWAFVGTIVVDPRRVNLSQQ